MKTRNEFLLFLSSHSATGCMSMRQIKWFAACTRVNPKWIFTANRRRNNDRYLLHPELIDQNLPYNESWVSHQKQMHRKMKMIAKNANELKIADTDIGSVSGFAFGTAREKEDMN